MYTEPRVRRPVLEYTGFDLGGIVASDAIWSSLPDGAWWQVCNPTDADVQVWLRCGTTAAQIETVAATSSGGLHPHPGVVDVAFGIVPGHDRNVLVLLTHRTKD